jgi:2-polyprenyl-3-methyl-5-hydroxy-6-metoxy-1,4-benzoquinol methylase
MPELFPEAKCRKKMKESPEDNSGLRTFLTNPTVYVFFQRLLGGRGVGAFLATNFWKLKGGETVVDIGCASGFVLDYMPVDVRYYGVDISKKYIDAAQKKFSARGNFLLGTAQDLLNNGGNALLKKVDLVTCNGLLHHLTDDEAIEILEISKQFLRPGGRLVCLEATFLTRQTRLSKQMVNMDRGRYVRSEQQWKDLLARSFDNFSTSVVTGLIRIPYTHIVIQCVNEQ